MGLIDRLKCGKMDNVELLSQLIGRRSALVNNNIRCTAYFIQCTFLWIAALLAVTVS
jgi:hypothetical protein